MFFPSKKSSRRWLPGGCPALRRGAAAGRLPARGGLRRAADAAQGGEGRRKGRKSPGSNGKSPGKIIGKYGENPKNGGL